MKMDCIILSDNEYAIIEKVRYNNNDYLYLANLNKEDDFTIKKIKIKNNETYYCGLDNMEEFNNVIMELSKKINIQN